MSLPRFLDRVIDATAPALGGIGRDVVQAKLEKVSVSLVAGERAAQGPARDGFLLAANLAARLYPTIRLEGPDALVADAEAQIAMINPRDEVVVEARPTSATLYYEAVAEDAADSTSVEVAAREWNVYVDVAAEGDEPSALAALLAAALGMGEVFRAVFADELGARGRRDRQGGAFNLVTLGEPAFGLPQPKEVDVGEFRLVGAGAIGQAAAMALAATGARGTMVVVDNEEVALSNLQRYVLTRDTDVDAVKSNLLAERLVGSELTVVPIKAEWHAAIADRLAPTLVALDSPEARIGVQSSLPGAIYNAWTQPADVGWSRHEQFGDEPCLACLYWPTKEKPSLHEQIGEAFHQHPLRTLAYLVRRLPVGLPLPPGGIPQIPGVEAPDEATTWEQRALVDDIAVAAGVDAAELASWRNRLLLDVYQEGICGGALLHLDVGVTPRDVLVPLAHQSALAGVMLAVEFLVAQVPELRAVRPAAVEGRFDVLSGLPQVLARPRARTPGCLCGDVVFRAVYRGKLGEEALAPDAAEATAEVTG